VIRAQISASMRKYLFQGFLQISPGGLKKYITTGFLMEAERINLIGTSLADLTARTAALRGYL
jgi:hypothetical protein